MPSHVVDVPTASSSTADLIAHREGGDETPLNQLLSVSTTILQQAIELVEQVLTSDDQLTITSKHLPGSTIGKHLRHARDYFMLLTRCVDGHKPHILSYDVRVRNVPMESSRAAALDQLREMVAKLEDVVPKVHLDEPITLNAVTPHMQILETSFGRELWFAALHAVHHWSMIRVIAGEQGIELAPDFGFAPSTLVYKGHEAPLGKTKM